MGFSNYGVLVGTITGYERDTPNNQGKYFHGNIKFNLSGDEYRCAVDVDSSTTPIQWRILDFSASQLAMLSTLSDGWHHLASNDSSGAIDYIRWRLMWISIVIRIPIFIQKAIIRIPPWISPVPLKRFEKNKLRTNGPFSLRWMFPASESSWQHGNNIDAIEQLETVAVIGKKAYIFGERFSGTGHGVHNIHQNQGDPVGEGHDGDNAIWQDGATIVRNSNGTYKGFFNKFSTQAFRTDDQGHPI